MPHGTPGQRGAGQAARARLVWITMPALGIGVTALLLAASRGRAPAVRRIPAWRSATEGVEGEDCYTSFGDAVPTRRILSNVLLTRTELKRLKAESEQLDTGYSA